MDLPEEAKRASPAPIWNQSSPSPKALFVHGTFFIRCYPLVHSRGRSPIRNLGTWVAAVVPQLASGTVPLPLTPPVCELFIVYFGKFRYIYCLVIGLFNGQFRFSENLMYEKKFVKITFAESLQWLLCNYLLFNKKDSSHCN